MERNWETFAQGPVIRFGERLHASINPRGSIFLNRKAIEAMGEPDHVVLMYDRRRSTIGVARAPSSNTSAFRLRRKDSSKSGSRVIYAANFCRFYSICPDETLAFMAAEVDKNGVLILDLNEVRSVTKI